MFKKKILFSVLFAALIAGTSLAAHAQHWASLGSRDVSNRVDHDTIVVTGSRGTFKRLKFTVTKRAIEFYRVVVHYSNGTSESLALRQHIPAGGETRQIDLRGNNRIIRSIEFWYNAKSLLGQNARIHVFGAH
jgi:hypothetical protein